MRKNGIMRTVLLLFIITSLTLYWSPFSGGAAEAKTFRLVIGAGHPPVLIWIERLRDFFCVEVEKRVKEKTGHEIKWVQAFGGTVAKLDEVLEATQGGSLDVGFQAIPFEPTKLYLHNFVYYVPFGLSDLQQMSDVALKVYDEVPYLKDVFEQKYNQKLLKGGLVQPGYVIISKFPIEKAEDLKNKKIGGAGPNLTWVEAPGAVPVTTTFGDAYTSIKTGVFEGLLALIGMIPAGKFYEVTDYYVECGFGAVFPGLITVNLDKWKELPDEIKEIMNQVSYEYTYDQAKATTAQNVKALEILKDKGMKMSTLPFEERAKWANLLPNIPNEAAKKANQMGMPGTEVFKAFIALQEKAGHKFPRRWVIE